MVCQPVCSEPAHLIQDAIHAIQNFPGRKRWYGTCENGVPRSWKVEGWMRGVSVVRAKERRRERKKRSFQPKIEVDRVRATLCSQPPHRGCCLSRPVLIHHRMGACTCRMRHAFIRSSPIATRELLFHCAKNLLHKAKVSWPFRWLFVPVSVPCKVTQHNGSRTPYKLCLS
jgi:hypothetical protein